MVCSICDRQVFARGWCVGHYKRWYRYGDPQAGLRTRRTAPLRERIERYIVRGDGCWGWTGATAAFGYGVIGRQGRGGGNVQAHRAMWELTHGPVPEGLCVLHTCDNPPCTNPAHLWLGTRADNNRDMTAKGRHWRHK